MVPKNDLHIVKDTLEEQDREFEYLFTNMAIGVVYHDRSGAIVKANPAAQTILGLSLDQMMGKTSLDPSWHTIKEDGSDFPGNEHPAMVTLHTQRAVHNVIMGVYHPKLQKHTWILVNSEPRFKNNQLESVFATFTDITDRLLLQKDLEQNERLLIAQSRHAAMGEMISMIAHQWRQPITIISMLANTILADIKLESVDLGELEKFAEQINANTKELSKTIDDFRNFFKPVTEPEVFMLKSVFDDTNAIVNKSLEHNGIDCKVECTDDILVYGHPRELVQVILNIVKNSIEELSNKPDQRNIFVQCKKTDTINSIEISDNGSGIKDEYLDKIFDPYFSTKEDKNGTGLGLYMSKTIIEKHFHGTINAQNTKDGVCFHIYLPVVKNV